MKKKERNETPTVDLLDDQIEDLEEIGFDWDFHPCAENPVGFHLDIIEMAQHSE